MLRSSTAVLTASFFAVGIFLSPANAADTTHKGDVTLTLKTAKGLQRNGSPDPDKDQACADKFQNVLGQKVQTPYTLNTQTNMMSARSTLMGKAYPLYPLGIAGQYSFGQYMQPVPGPMPIYGVLFSLDTQFASPVSSLILQLSNETNCLISSADSPLEGKERIRFGTSP